MFAILKRIKKAMQQVNTIDLKIVFSEDAKEWDKYLTDCLMEAIESASYQLQIVHERIENVQINKFEDEQANHLTSNLIVISPDFLVYVQQNENLRNYFKQFKIERTLCMLCGVKECEISRQIKENLVQFESWKCLIAKEQDNEFIYSVIDSIYNILHRNNHLDEIYSTYSFITSIRSKRPLPIPNYANEYKNLDSIKVIDEEQRQQTKKIKFCKFKLTPKKIKKVRGYSAFSILNIYVKL